MDEIAKQVPNYEQNSYQQKPIKTKKKKFQKKNVQKYVADDDLIRKHFESFHFIYVKFLSMYCSFFIDFDRFVNVLLFLLDFYVKKQKRRIIHKRWHRLELSIYKHMCSMCISKNLLKEVNEDGKIILFNKRPNLYQFYVSSAHFSWLNQYFSPKLN